MKRVLFLHSSNELYGADRSLLRLTTTLDKAHFSPFVVLPNDLSYSGLLKAELQRNEVPVLEANLSVLRRKYLSLSGILFFLRNYFQSNDHLTKLGKQLDINLIHTNSAAILNGVVVSRNLKIPHAWHVREIIKKPRWLNTIIANIMLASPGKVIAVSEAVKENLVLTQPKLENKIKVIHNGIDPTPFLIDNLEKSTKLRQQWNGTKDTIVIGMIGRVSSWKGQELLLNAFAQLIPNHPKLVLVLVGGCVPDESWRMDKLVDRVNSMGIKSNVHIEEFRTDIPDVLSAFDIFVLPSTLPDPFPTVVLEAMASAKPVVATAHGGALEQVEHGVTGFLVTPNDPSAMAKALEVLIEDRALITTFGAAGRKRLNKLFSVQSHVANIQSLYSELLANR